jgi:hypothetical protein
LSSATSIRTALGRARITRYGDQQRATVRQVEKATELGDVHPSEEMPVEDALRLARHRVVDTAGDEILVELETGTSWQGEWGTLT